VKKTLSDDLEEERSKFAALEEDQKAILNKVEQDALKQKETRREVKLLSSSKAETDQKLREQKTEIEEQQDKIKALTAQLSREEDRIAAYRQQVRLVSARKSGHDWLAVTPIRQGTYPPEFSLTSAEGQAFNEEKENSSPVFTSILDFVAADVNASQENILRLFAKSMTDSGDVRDLSSLQIDYLKTLQALKSYVRKRVRHNEFLFVTEDGSPSLREWILPDPTETYAPLLKEDLCTTPSAQQSSGIHSQVSGRASYKSDLTLPVISVCQGTTVVKTNLDDQGVSHYVEAEVAVWGHCAKRNVAPEPKSPRRQAKIWPLKTKYASFTTHVMTQGPSYCDLPGTVAREGDGVAQQRDLIEFFRDYVQQNESPTEADARVWAALTPFVNQTTSVSRLGYRAVRPLGVDFCGLVLLQPETQQDKNVIFMGIAAREFQVDVAKRSVACSSSTGGFHWSYQEVWNEDEQRFAVVFTAQLEPHIVEIRWCVESAFRYPFMGNAALYFMLRFPRTLVRQRSQVTRNENLQWRQSVVALDDFFGSPGVFNGLLVRLAIFEAIKLVDPELTTNIGLSVQVQAGENKPTIQLNNINGAVIEDHVSQFLAHWNTHGVVLASRLEVLGLDQ
jgi:hypothetical protein